MNVVSRAVTAALSALLVLSPSRPAPLSAQARYTPEGLYAAYHELYSKLPQDCRQGRAADYVQAYKYLFAYMQVAGQRLEREPDVRSQLNQSLSYLQGVSADISFCVTSSSSSRCGPAGCSSGGITPLPAVPPPPRGATAPVRSAAGGALAGEYRIRVAATGQYLHENGLGDRLMSTRHQVDDDYTRFILEPQSDGSYRIRVKAHGRYVHNDGGGDQIMSTRYQVDDDFTRFDIERQSDGTFLIRVRATGRYVRLDEDGLLSTRTRVMDGRLNFRFEAVGR